MTCLAAFLHARISDDLATAERVVDRLIEIPNRPGILSVAGATVYDARRAGREITAKYWILSRFITITGHRRVPTDRPGVYDTEPVYAISPDDGAEVLRALAAVYADHPDYDPAWR